MDNAAIGKRVSQLRKEKGLSQEKLAEMTGMTLPHLNRLENGKRGFSLNSLVSLANALNTTVETLIFGKSSIQITEVDRGIKLMLQDCNSNERNMLYESSKSLVRTLPKDDD